VAELSGSVGDDDDDSKWLQQQSLK
jgi:hypothetical protein